MKKIMRKTQRLILRPLEIKDYKVWWEAHSRMLPPQNLWDRGARKKSELTPTEYKKIVQRYRNLSQQDNLYNFGIFERVTGRLVGMVSAMNIVRGVTQMGYLGYAIYNNYWGRGFGKEAVLTMVEIAFRDLKLHRFEAGVEPHNRRSILLARSVGLRKEGLKKRAIFQRNKWVDLVIYSATCEEFGFKWRGKI